MNEEKDYFFLFLHMPYFIFFNAEDGTMLTFISFCCCGFIKAILVFDEITFEGKKQIPTGVSYSNFYQMLARML